MELTSTMNDCPIPKERLVLVVFEAVPHAKLDRIVELTALFVYEVGSKKKRLVVPTVSLQRMFVIFPAVSDCHSLKFVVLFVVVALPMTNFHDEDASVEETVRLEPDVPR